MQFVARQHASERLCRFRVPLVLRVPLAELHQRIHIHSLKSVAMLQVPVADRFTIAEVATISSEGNLELCRCRCAVATAHERPTRRRDVALELDYVEVLDQ